MDAGLLDDLDSQLSNWGFEEDLRNAPGVAGMAQGGEDTIAKATGYLISTAPSGQLPKAFWGHSRPHSFCTLFKVGRGGGSEGCWCEGERNC